MLRQGGGEGPSFSSFVAAIPAITKYLIIIVLGTSILVNLQVLDPALLLLRPNLIIYRLQIWRIFTPFIFLGALNFKTLMSCFFLLQFSRDLENEVFGGRKADYLWMLILGGILMLIPGFLLPLPILSFSLQTYIMYVGCNMQPEKTMGLMFIPVAIPAIWFTYVIVGMHLLMSPGLLLFDVVGILAGHFYFFFKELWPKRENGSILFFMKTPGVIEKFFEPERLTNFTGRFYGSGRRLDD